LGCAPSPEILAEWNKREAELISTTSLSRVVAQPPQPQNVHAGCGDEEIKTKVGKEGARTIPGRPEHGGNCDIKNLSRGSKVYLPVHVKGAKFSVGDLHFSRMSILPSPFALFPQPLFNTFSTPQTLSCGTPH
jgi:formamidase